MSGNAAVFAPDNDRRIRALIASAKQHAEHGRHPEADRLMRQAEMEAPRHPSVQNEVALRMLKSGNAAGAHTLLEQAAKADSSNWEVWFNLAAALRKLDRIDEAIAALEKRPEKRRAILLISDGCDTSSSKATFDSVIKKALAACLVASRAWIAASSRRISCRSVSIRSANSRAESRSIGWPISCTLGALRGAPNTLSSSNPAISRSRLPAPAGIGILDWRLCVNASSLRDRPCS